MWVERRPLYDYLTMYCGASSILGACLSVFMFRYFLILVLVPAIMITITVMYDISRQLHLLWKYCLRVCLQGDGPARRRRALSAECLSALFLAAVISFVCSRLP